MEPFCFSESKNILSPKFTFSKITNSKSAFTKLQICFEIFFKNSVLDKILKLFFLSLAPAIFLFLLFVNFLLIKSVIFKEIFTEAILIFFKLLFTALTETNVKEKIITKIKVLLIIFLNENFFQTKKIGKTFTNQKYIFSIYKFILKFTLYSKFCFCFIFVGSIPLGWSLFVTILILLYI